MEYIKRKMRLFGALFMALGILLGALGSHYLKTVLSVSALESFDVGNRYLIYQGLGLLLLSVLGINDSKAIKRLYYLIVGGTVLFSGSIFILSFKSYLPFPVSFLGPFTPIGGTALIIGWSYTVYIYLTEKD